MNGWQMETSNKYVIRFANPDEWEDAMELAWRTFLKFEAEEYGEEGKKNFLEFISGEQLFKMFLEGSYKLVVAYYNDVMVGMGSLRSGHHISLLFVDEKYHRKGIATNIVSMLQSTLTTDIKLTVNASPYGEGFYSKIGFIPTDVKQTADGITFLPMACLGRVKETS